jgi:NAD(P)H-dependent FMN reductase
VTKVLLIIAHTPSVNTKALGDAALRGASVADAGDITARLISPFDVVADDLFAADGLILGTTENIGYMAGATKDMFDRCYNDWLDRTQAMPVGLYIRAGLDGTATRRALEGIFSAQKWRLVTAPMILHGDWSEDYPTEVEEMAMAMAAGLDAGIF